MNDKLNLRELKGAPLSILVLLAMCRQNVSASYICRETGYSANTVTDGLRLLQDRQLISRAGHSGFMLTGNNWQLPLSWNEQVEPVLPETAESAIDPSEITILKKQIRDLEDRVRKLETGISPIGTGNIPIPEAVDNGVDKKEIGNSPIEIVKTPIEVGENTIADELINTYTPPDKVSKYDIDINTYLLKDGAIGNSPIETGEIPELFRTAWTAAMQQMEGQMGKGSYSMILSGAVPIGYEEGHYTISMDNAYKRDWAETRLQKNIENMLSSMLSVPVSVSFVLEPQPAASEPEPEQDFGAPSLELLPVPEDPQEAALTNICNDYLVQPDGIDYSKDELRELIRMHADPEVLHYILPRATRFENAKIWCSKDIVSAKKALLRKYQITKALASEISHNEYATMEMIEDLCEQYCPNDPGLVGVRIRDLTADGKPLEF